MISRHRLLAAGGTGVIGCILFACLASAQETVVIDKILATVDKEAILLSDILNELGPGIQELRKTAPSQEAFDTQLNERIKATLEQAIDNKILLREAQLAGMAVPDNLVEKRLDEMKATEGFDAYVAASGETMPELRDRLRKNLLAMRFARDKRDEFAKTVTVSESEVAQYYQDRPSEFGHSERVRVRQIFLPAKADDKQARAVAKARLDEVQKELDAGADFAELAKTYSQGPGAAEGGVIGWVARGDLTEALEMAAFALEAGKCSGIVESDYGLHILKADEKEGAGQSALEDARKDIEPVIRNQEAAKLFAKWITGLRKRSQVRVLLED